MRDWPPFILALALVVTSACTGATSAPPAARSTEVAPSAVRAAASCPAPRSPTYLPWGTSVSMQQSLGPVSTVRSDTQLASFVLERRSDNVGAPTTVTAAPWEIMSRRTYLIWAGALGSSDLDAWWEEGSGACRVYHARLRMNGAAADIEPQFVKVIASIPAAFVDPNSGITGLLADIALEHTPSSVAVMPFEDRLFVADTEGGLSVFDTATNKLLDRVILPLSGRGAAIAAVPATKRVYVTDRQAGRVLVVDGSTLALLAMISPVPAPTAIVADIKANRLYVASAAQGGAAGGGPTAGSVEVIDGAASTVLATVITRGDPVTLDVDSLTARLYVGARGLEGQSSAIQVIDVRTASEVASVGVSAPSVLVADPVDQAVYAISPNPSSAFGSKWIELDERTNGAATFVDGPGDARALGWHPGTDDRYRRIYVASHSDVGGTLHIFRSSPGTTRLASAGVVRVGTEPVAITVDGASHRVYVASAGDRIISVVLQGPG